MARKVRFPLNMNGIQVRTLEELQENFHLESVLAYFHEGKLEQWVRDRYFDDKADAIAALDKSDSELSKKLCEILEVEYSAEADIDMEEIERRNEKMKELRKYCDDKEVIENIANVALTQDDLYDLLDEGKDKIYLVHGKFEIPSKANVTYIGKANPEVKVNNFSALEEKEIKLVNIIADGDAEQLNELGIKYSDGDAIPKDMNKAIEYFKKAAEQGDANAQFNLALHYHNGEGLAQDISKAIEWYTKAAEQGNSGAQLSLNNIEIKMNKESASQGDTKAMIALGDYYQKRGRKRQAIDWYTKAAEQGDSDAQYILGLCYEKGNCVPLNKSKAVEWYRKAAKQRNKDATEALRNLGKTW